MLEKFSCKVCQKISLVKNKTNMLHKCDSINVSLRTYNKEYNCTINNISVLIQQCPKCFHISIRMVEWRILFNVTGK